MAIVSRVMFGLVNFAARKGISDADSAGAAGTSRTVRAHRTGVRGETFAYWYLRRHGYVFVARNYKVPGIKGEIDLIGYDGEVLAFVEVKTRSCDDERVGLPEDAVNATKRHVISRMARAFLRNTRTHREIYRFDILAIETRRGARPVVRLHKDAFAEQR
jgi:putative endonuclease